MLDIREEEEEEEDKERIWFETASAIAAGRSPPGWHTDERGITTTYVPSEDVFRDAKLVCRLLRHGFEPGGGSIDMYNCNRVIDPRRMKVQRRTLKRLALEGDCRYELRVDSAWDEVVRKIQEFTWSFTPGDCWLSDDLAASLASARRSEEAARHRVAFHCIELWHGTKLVAANIGYTIGAIYSGFTKFYSRDDKQYSGVGIMMSSALGAWLSKCGFKLYAMGQNAPYKQEGILRESFTIDGLQWLNEVRSARGIKEPPSVLPQDDSPVFVKDLIGGLDVQG